MSELMSSNVCCKFDLHSLRTHPLASNSKTDSFLYSVLKNTKPDIISLAGESFEDLDAERQEVLTHYFASAYAHADKSPDPSTQNAAIIVPENADTVSGVNGPIGYYDKNLYAENRDYRLQRTVHAEMRAILNAARSGISLENAMMVCPWASCMECAKAIAVSGISVLVRHRQAHDHAKQVRAFSRQYSWEESVREGDQCMRSCGVTIIEVDYKFGFKPIRQSGVEFYP